MINHQLIIDNINKRELVYWKNIMECIMQLLFILLRYDSREHYFAGSKNTEEVSSSIFCAERRCMCIKSPCVVHISALIILVKCLLYRIAESDPLVNRATQTSSLQSREEKAMSCSHPAQAFASGQVCTVHEAWGSCTFSK